MRIRYRVADIGDEFADRYRVLVGRHYWDMSANADQPNGCCIYGGYTDGAWCTPAHKVLPRGAELPHGLRRQMARLIREARHEARAPRWDVPSQSWQ